MRHACAEFGSEELTHLACKISSRKSQSEVVVTAIKAARAFWVMTIPPVEVTLKCCPRKNPLLINFLVANMMVDLRMHWSKFESDSVGDLLRQTFCHSNIY